MISGLRFGLLQTKVGLITLLRNHKVTLSEKTPLPLHLEPTAIIMTSTSDIWLNITKIEKKLQYQYVSQRTY